MTVGLATGAKILSPIAKQVIGAGLPILGDILGGFLGAGQSERMSSTAYQRAVGDMRKAGINPMLAYMKGGASTPEFKQNLGGSTGMAVSSAIQLRRQNEELENLRAQREQTEAATQNTNADTAGKMAELPKKEFYAQLWQYGQEVANRVQDTYETQGPMAAALLLLKLAPKGKRVLTRGRNRTRGARKQAKKKSPRKYVDKRTGEINTREEILRKINKRRGPRR